MHRLIATIVLLLLPALGQSQNAELRQARIYAGDVAELTITHDAGIPSMYAIDPSVLETDFEVLDSSSRVFRVQQEGQSWHRMQWSIRLLPRRSGILDIPQLKFGDNYSQALRLTVEPVPAGLQSAQNVFVEIEASPQYPYPGQQTRIVTRLFHNLAIDKGALYEPKSTQSRAFRSGRDIHYEVIRDGHSFTVLERSILLIPQALTEMQVQPATFNASFPSINHPDTPALDGGIRHIYRNSNALNLKQRDLPVGIDAADWLPAQQLELSLEWENRNATLLTGDSLGVVLNIQVTGLPAEALPANLLLRDSDQFKIYADQETRSTQVTGAPGEEQLTGQLRQRYAIVLDQAGEVILPGVKLKWWDVDQDQARVAKLETITLSVVAPDSTADRIRGSDIIAAHNSTAARLLPLSLQPSWYWLLIALSGLCLGALVWLTRRRWSVITELLEELRRRRRCLKAVERACGNNDAIAARKGLVEWGRAHWNDAQISSLRQIASRGSKDWATELVRLDAAVFAAHNRAWQGAELLHLVRQQHHNPGATIVRQTENQLPEPYPRTAPSCQATTNPWPV